MIKKCCNNSQNHSSSIYNIGPPSSMTTLSLTMFPMYPRTYVYLSSSLHNRSTVEARYNEVQRTLIIGSLYAACVITEAADITNLCHATSLYPEFQF